MDIETMSIPPSVRDLLNAGALFVANHSGGKDSQAMLAFLRLLIPARQLLVVHATLGEIEWPGTIDHIKTNSGGLPLVVAQALKKDGSKRTFLNMVDDKFARVPDVSPWPSPKQRQCTSDLKRGPIEREIRRYLESHPEFGGVVVNCTGLRAGESSARAKATPFKRCARNSKAGREWYEWLPIFGLHTLEVFAAIAQSGQQPHWCYQEGMSRMSCCLCIMSSEDDLALGAKLRPVLLVAYVVREKSSGYTFRMDRRPLDRFAANGNNLTPALPALAGITPEWSLAA